MRLIKLRISGLFFSLRRGSSLLTCRAREFGESICLGSHAWFSSFSLLESSNTLNYRFAGTSVCVRFEIKLVNRLVYMGTIGVKNPHQTPPTRRGGGQSRYSNRV
jgi:hypothetical protein